MEEEKRFKIKEVRDEIRGASRDVAQYSVSFVLGAGVSVMIDYMGIQLINTGNPLVTGLILMSGAAITAETIHVASQLKNSIIEYVDKLRELKGGKTR